MNMKKMTRNLNCRGRRWPVLLVLMLAFLLLPAAAQAAKDFTVTGGVEGEDWDYGSSWPSGYAVNFKKGGEYVVSMPSDAQAATDRIQINAAAISNDTGRIKLTFSNLKINTNLNHIVE